MTGRSGVWRLHIKGLARRHSQSCTPRSPTLPRPMITDTLLASERSGIETSSC
jgi:hypothetical protein